MTSSQARPAWESFSEDSTTVGGNATAPWETSLSFDCSHAVFEPVLRVDGTVEAFVCVGGIDGVVGPESEGPSSLPASSPHEEVGTIVRPGHPSPVGTDFDFLLSGLTAEHSVEVIHEVPGAGERYERLHAWPVHRRVVVARRDTTPLHEAQAGWRRTLEMLRVKMDVMLDPQVLIEAVRDEHDEVVDFRFLDVNAAACRYFGSSRERLRGMRYSVGRPGMSAGMVTALAGVIETGESLSLEDQHFVNEATGHQGWFDVRAARVGGGVSLTWRDVSERHAASTRLADSERLFRAVAGAASDIVALVSQEIRAVWWSPSVTALLGWAVEEVLGRGQRDLVHPADLAAAAEHVAAVVRGESPGPMRLRLLCRDGSYRWMEGQLRCLDLAETDGTPYLAVFRDIDAHVHSEERLRETERIDRLTGLANRSVALERIAEHLARDARGPAILCIDVNGMAVVNAARGYAAGDLVLATVAQRLIEAAGSADLVMRVAGDEFAMILPGVAGSGEAAHQANRVMEAVREPVDVDGDPVDVTVSIGVALSEGTSADSVLTRATAAMRQAAAAGPHRWQFLDEAQNDRARQRLLIRAGLRLALEREELRPWLMPVVDLASRDVVGFEALVRWHSPDGILTPDRFLPAAAQMGLAAAVDRAVFLQLVRAMRDIPPRYAIGYNVTGETIGEPGFAEWAVTMLDAGGIDPSRIQIEVTEVGLVNVDRVLLGNLRVCREVGMGIWLDDFGTGFSSISHLRNLPITGMKLDKSFAPGSPGTHDEDHHLAAGLVGLARALGLSTIAEGIETAAQAEVLRQMGWACGQGYLFGKPAPLAEWQFTA